MLVIILLIISLVINLILGIILIINYKPEDYVPVYTINYKLKCKYRDTFYPTWEEEHHITILYSKSRNKYTISSSDSNHRSRNEYIKIIEELNKLNKTKL